MSRMACRRRVRRASAVSLLLLALTLAAGASVARADGDPASDYLLGNEVFLTSQSTSISPGQRQLIELVRAANRAGFGIRVALISTSYDLGSITPLWRRPSVYARFLGLELSLAFKQRLLVVMPNGFGFSWPGHSSAPEYRLLDTVQVGAGANALAVAAQTAVMRLAGADGVSLASTASARRTGGGTTGSVSAAVLGGAAAAVAALAALSVALARAWQRGWRPRRPPRPVPLSLRWAVPAFAVCGVAVAAPIIVLRRHATPSVSDAVAAAVVTPPPFSWPAGRRPAPNFVLRDQAGRPVSLAAYRGRPVIVTFIDPVCRNLCPLEAQVLNQAERQMPASQRPAILAVSVDVYAQTRADMLQDESKWHLVPQWRWGVGRPAQLAAVWKQYRIAVRVTTKKISDTTINYITHTEGAYIIDASGHERALFLWPFYPQDVKRVLHQLA